MFLVTGTCEKMGFLLRIVAKLFYYLRIIVPIILILFVIYDLTMVVIKGEEKEKKEAFEKIVKRLIYALIVFLIPTLVSFVFRRIEKVQTSDGKGEPTSWISCWNYYYSNK